MSARSALAALAVLVVLAPQASHASTVSVPPWKSTYQHKGPFEACQMITKMSNGGAFDLVAGGGNFRLVLLDPAETFTRQSPEVTVNAAVDKFPPFTMSAKAFGPHLLDAHPVDPKLALELILLGRQAVIDFGPHQWRIDLVDSSNSKGTFFHCVNHLSPPIAPPKTTGAAP